VSSRNPDEAELTLRASDWSARSRNDSEIVKPSALAVLRLTTSLNVVGCSTGISAGLVPRQDLVEQLGGAPEQSRNV
jgi:hypothetical protein